MPSREKLICAGFAIATAAACATATGQQRIWYAESDVFQDGFGFAFEVESDVDGDGIPELVIGAPGRTCVLFQDGSASVFSTANGELHRWCGAAQEDLGLALAVMPDVDADGVPDLLVGAPGYWDPFWGFGTGRVVMLSGASGAELFSIAGNQPQEHFGIPVAALPDLDGDGWSEFMIGSPGFSVVSGEGRVDVMSSKDGSILRTHVGESQADSFGRTICMLRDVDGDGVADYAVGASLDLGQLKGRVYVYSGATGGLIAKWTGGKNLEELGYSIAACGDLDGDGLADVLIGGVVDKGHLYAYSPQSGNLIWQVEGDAKLEMFGAACVTLGDMNGDGYDEIAVSAWQDDHVGIDSGRVDLISGRTLRPLYRFYPPYPDGGFGHVLRGGADFNGDSIPDLVISAPNARFSTPQGGRVTIYAGNDLFLQADQNDVQTGDTVTFAIRGGDVGAISLLALLDVSGTKMFVPVAVDLLDSNGEWSVAADVPPSASGLDFTLRGYAQRLTGRPHVVDTSRVKVRVQ